MKPQESQGATRKAEPPLAVCEEALARMLAPSSIAVVGASRDPGKMSGQIVSSLLEGGFTGQLFPVNARAESICGLPTVASLAEIGAPVDHCVIAVPASGVLTVVEECVENRVGGATILASGFGEFDEAGLARQDEIAKAAKGMPFLGPNCMGFANIAQSICSTSRAGWEVCRRLDRGGTALVTQSGGLGFASLGYFGLQAEIGFSYIINIGNGAGVNAGELWKFLEQDRDTAVVTFALEDDRQVAKLYRALRQTGVTKPVIVLKAGRSTSGAAMVASHTGALSASPRLVEDLLEEEGVVCVRDLDEMVGAIQICETFWHRRSEIADRLKSGVVALSISGGNLALLCDNLEEHGVRFSPLSGSASAKLRAVLPSFVRVDNPVDLTAVGAGGTELTEKVLEILATSDAAFVVPIITTLRDYSDVAQAFVAAAADSRTPILVLWTGGTFDGSAKAILREGRIPIVQYGNTLGRILERFARGWSRFETRRQQALGQAQAEGPLNLETPAEGAVIQESEAHEWLRRWGLPGPEVLRAAGLREVEQAAAAVGFPVAVKRDSVETHQAKDGGVLGDLRSAEELRQRMRSSGLDREKALLVMRWLPGAELICSTFVHPEMGRILIVGEGGADAELRGAVRFCGIPATRYRIEEIVRRLDRVSEVARREKLDSAVDEAVELVVRIARIAEVIPEYVQIELNPITLGAAGANIVDAAIWCRHGGQYDPRTGGRAN